MKISILVAAAENGVIGREGDLPWHLPDDLRRFKAITMGHHLLMGRKTFDSIGKALPGRTTVVISRGNPELPEGVQLAGSFDDALEIARSAGEDEAFVVGGAEIYRMALYRANRLYLTRVHEAFEGDALFPLFDEREWILISEEERPADEENLHDVSFLVYERRTDSLAAQLDPLAGAPN